MCFTTLFCFFMKIRIRNKSSNKMVYSTNTVFCFYNNKKPFARSSEYLA